MAEDTDEPDVPRSGRGFVDDTMPASPPSMDAPSRPSRPPPAPERYQLGGELGRGGMGRVVEALDTRLGRNVAVKEALPHRGGQGAYRRFQREIKITAALEHASIVPLYDCGETPDGRPYYVMRRVSGRPFDEMISRARNLGERLTLLPALLAAMDAIAHAHKRSIIHRDLKPANILVADLGETVVIDWGLAKKLGDPDPELASIEPDDAKPSDSLRTQVGAVFGTPGFMAPEQARGEELSTRSDVYALGACLYQLLAGVPPFGGSTSATEVIDRTRKNQIRPLSETAPGAPRELVAITTKALSLEPSARYASAAQLGEDVRRFLSGQLVAAHQYTRRQRVVRFARRNRLALSISAIAAVVIAVLTWTNVSRIIHEREMERDAKVLALQNEDELILDRASQLVRTDPTRALAVLRKLQPDSPRDPEARAIAQAAVMAGVAWGIETNEDQVLPPEISPDGKRVVMATLGGVMQIYDLENRALLRTKLVARGARGMWLDNGKRLLVWGGAPPYLLDPATNQSTSIALATLRLVVGDRTGQYFLYDTPGVVGRVDLATLRPSVLWQGAGKVTLADDASCFAVQVDGKITIYDPAGVEIASHDLDEDLVWLQASSDHRLALSSAKHILELALDTKTWTDRTMTFDSPNVFILQVLWHGPRLAAFLTSGRFFDYSNDHWVERMHVPTIQGAVRVIGSDVAIVASQDKLYWAAGTATGSVALPAMEVRNLTGRPGVTQALVVGRDLVAVFDLKNTIPERVPGDALAGMFFALDDDAIVTYTNGAPWTLIRLSTGDKTEIPFQWTGMPMPPQVLGSEKRALFVFNEIRAHLIEIRDDPRPLRSLANGPVVPGRPDQAMVLGTLVPGDATVFADADSRIYVTFADGHATELAQLDGQVREVAPLGRLRFAAISENGEVLRGGLDGSGSLERTHVPARDDLVIGHAGGGRVAIGVDREIYLWDRELKVVAKLDKPAWALQVVAGGKMFAELTDRSAVLVDLDTGAVQPLLPHGVRDFQLSADGSLLVALDDAGRVHVGELPSGATFELPTTYSGMGRVVVTPTSREILVGDSAIDAWHLPVITGDLQSWIAKQTNAEDRGKAVVWDPLPSRAP